MNGKFGKLFIKSLPVSLGVATGQVISRFFTGCKPVIYELIIIFIFSFLTSLCVCMLLNYFFYKKEF